MDVQMSRERLCLAIEPLPASAKVQKEVESDVEPASNTMSHWSGTLRGPEILAGVIECTEDLLDFVRLPCPLSKLGERDALIATTTKSRELEPHQSISIPSASSLRAEKFLAGSLECIEDLLQYLQTTVLCSMACLQPQVSMTAPQTSLGLQVVTSSVHSLLLSTHDSLYPMFSSTHVMDVFPTTGDPWMDALAVTAGVTCGVSVALSRPFRLVQTFATSEGEEDMARESKTTDTSRTHPSIPRNIEEETVSTMADRQSLQASATNAWMPDQPSAAGLRPCSRTGSAEDINEHSSAENAGQEQREMGTPARVTIANGMFTYLRASSASAVTDPVINARLGEAFELEVSSSRGSRPIDVANKQGDLHTSACTNMRQHIAFQRSEEEALSMMPDGQPAAQLSPCPNTGSAEVSTDEHLGSKGCSAEDIGQEQREVSTYESVPFANGESADLRASSMTGDTNPGLHAWPAKAREVDLSSSKGPATTDIAKDQGELHTFSSTTIQEPVACQTVEEKALSTMPDGQSAAQPGEMTPCPSTGSAEAIEGCSAKDVVHQQREMSTPTRANLANGQSADLKASSPPGFTNPVAHVGRAEAVEVEMFESIGHNIASARVKDKFIFFIRHAESVWNKPCEVWKQGEYAKAVEGFLREGLKKDHPLSPEGVNQAQNLHKRIIAQQRCPEERCRPESQEEYYHNFFQCLTDDSLVYCSPLLRALQTAYLALPRDGKIVLLRNAREVMSKGLHVCGLGVIPLERDCIGVKEGEDLVTRAETICDLPGLNDRVDWEASDCDGQWWSSELEDTEAIHKRMHDLSQCLLGDPEKSCCICVTHSILILAFLMQFGDIRFCESADDWQVSELTGGTLQSAKRRKLQNCGVLGVRLAFRDRQWRAVDACLMFESGFMESKATDAEKEAPSE